MKRYISPDVPLERTIGEYLCYQPAVPPERLSFFVPEGRLGGSFDKYIKTRSSGTFGETPVYLLMDIAF